MIVRSLRARKILNSRKRPTIEVIINKRYSAAAPSGASTGVHEAVAYTKGVDHAVRFFNNFRKLDGFSLGCFEDLEEAERIVPSLGANPMVALEFALLKAASKNDVWQFLNPEAKKVPMPVGNCIGGGAHIRDVKPGLKPDIQEFLLIPETENFRDAVRVNRRVHKEVGKALGVRELTDEGAWCPNMPNDKLLDILSRKAREAERKLNGKVRLGLDVAASTLWNAKAGRYDYRNFSSAEKAKSLDSGGQAAFMEELIKGYRLFYVEDPMEENDFEGFSKIKKGKCLVCGDDLICTSTKLLEKAIRHKSVNAIIVKPNQIGSLVKAREIVEMAFANRITPVISHRSGETMDATISHLAVAWGIPFIKCGIYGREREVKLDEVAKIEGQMGF